MKRRLSRFKAGNGRKGETDAGRKRAEAKCFKGGAAFLLQPQQKKTLSAGPSQKRGIRPS